ncbi:hypothetical protein K505DRAFT_360757 [Melanomma pulvis-pyrius CBS 109.77]|uniref:Uncharacterized protein n=1 Tax=Melanomma pulvis-pyrius CBS 109.77 TaxID=1314802 RepID=A0A6A6XEE7_9PLEO|nr:hypothetical protein K505DRAFT_360757 [Melanomma pulvis-pyrius CBS 109.77]
MDGEELSSNVKEVAMCGISGRSLSCLSNVRPLAVNILARRASANLDAAPQLRTACFTWPSPAVPGKGELFWASCVFPGHRTLTTPSFPPTALARLRSTYPAQPLQFFVAPCSAGLHWLAGPETATSTLRTFLRPACALPWSVTETPATTSHATAAARRWTTFAASLLRSLYPPSFSAVPVGRNPPLQRTPSPAPRIHCLGSAAREANYIADLTSSPRT